MFLDGARTNFKDHANFAVSLALNHPREHFDLAFAQSFGTGIESVAEFHNPFLQLRVMVACAGRTRRIFWIGGLHLCLFSNPLLFLRYRSGGTRLRERLLSRLAPQKAN